jgi:putative ABC transport system substrate-binding protein
MNKNNNLYINDYRRRWLLGSALLPALASPFAALAQQRDRVFRIGILFSSTPASAKPQVDPFLQGLQELGYVEGKNVVFEYRYAEGIFERLPTLAAELVQLKPDVIFVNNTPPALAAKQATTTIPIVFAAVASPVEYKVIASFARPGGNLTGGTNIATELTGKRLQILTDVFPRISRIAVVNYIPGVSAVQFAEVQREAKILGLDILRIEVRRREDFEQQITLIRNAGADAMYPLENAINGQLRNLITEFAAQSRLPAIYGSRQFVIAGGLMSYGTDLDATFRRAATYVDRILKGAKPADLPVERPTRFELLLNMKTARELGIKFPASILARADKVYD